MTISDSSAKIRLFRISVAALDMLLRLGYSLDVEADRRIMLGYITWHPFSSFDSLRATATFMNKYRAPPKLLRRVLRLYSQTSAVRDISQVGLLDPHHPRGWRFKDQRLETIEEKVNSVFGKVNRRRDQLRTLEKAAARHGYVVPMLERIKLLRNQCDQRLYSFFERCIGEGETDDLAVSRVRVHKLAEEELASFAEFEVASGVIESIHKGFQTCGFDSSVNDLFRK